MNSQKYLKKASAEIKIKDAEIKRLREALEHIANYDTLDGDKYINYERGWHGVALYARRALSPTGDSDLDAFVEVLKTTPMKNRDNT